ncbi:MAG: hypothetical protein JRJ85_23620 [Deltaproteobacteria bacterium]|nr:hypothetical protein [Deltaproteobacteria bacterium]
MGVVGLFALLLFCPGKADAQLGLMSQKPQPAPRYEVLSSKSGRFVFGQISGSSKDQFMLDTLTGRLWRIAESGDVGLYLREVPYRTGKETYDPVPGDAAQKPEEASKK